MRVLDTEFVKNFIRTATMDGSRDGTREMAETFPIVSGWKKWKP